MEYTHNAPSLVAKHKIFMSDETTNVVADDTVVAAPVAEDATPDVETEATPEEAPEEEAAA